MKKILSLAWQNALIRNSLVLFGGTMVVNVLNYLFHVLVGRQVEAHMYGEIESIISLLAIVSVPAATITMITTKFAAGMRADQNYRGTRFLASYLTRKVFVYSFVFFLGAI